jgi:hypothetical protein
MLSEMTTQAPKTAVKYSEHDLFTMAFSLLGCYRVIEPFGEVAGLAGYLPEAEFVIDNQTPGAGNTPLPTLPFPTDHCNGLCGTVPNVDSQTHRVFYRAVWAEAARVVSSGGPFVLRARPSAIDWHVLTLEAMGFPIVRDTRTALHVPRRGAPREVTVIVMLRRPNQIRKG